MTDRELLELAAKAAGIEWEQTSYSAGYVTQTGKFWNPLADDGDALRLAVKLGLSVDISHTQMNVQIYDAAGSTIAFESFLPINTETKVRRAITRAAAEIGKMKGEK